MLSNITQGSPNAVPFDVTLYNAQRHENLYVRANYVASRRAVRDLFQINCSD